MPPHRLRFHEIVESTHRILNPTDGACEAMGVGAEEFTSLAGTLGRIESTGLEIVEMVVADLDDWDRYEASQWIAARHWLDAHPEDPDAAEFRRWSAGNRRTYLEYGRRLLGWGVFVLRRASR